MLCPLVFPVSSFARLKILHIFSAAAPTNFDGAAPGARLVMGDDGALYGTTSRGAANGVGGIFRFGLDGSLSSLWSFSAVTNASGAINDNLQPNELALGPDGGLYGSLRRGGSNFTGAVFVLTAGGAFSNLYTFPPPPGNGPLQSSAAGVNPVGPLVLAGDGSFYGVTQFGGSNNSGTIFQVTPAGAFASLHSFARLATGATNGGIPNALTLGSDGALYGTTQQGGVLNAGSVFKFDLKAGFSQIASFNGGAPNRAPLRPDSALAPGAAGLFCGTSSAGGAQAGGSIFSVASSGDITLLYSFPLLDADAIDTVVADAGGSFYGTVSADGLNGSGAVYRLDSAGNFSAYYFTPLNATGANSDGANPVAALVGDGAGNYYGSCAAGGANGSGLIFQLSAADFAPPFFLTSANPPPMVTNTLIGAPLSLSYAADGMAPLSYQWTLNGANLFDGAGISGSTSSNLVITALTSADVGSYALVISNSLGALTSAVTMVAVKPPGVAIASPAPNARTAAPGFSGFATNAPLFPGADPNSVSIINVLYLITNLFNGSNLTGAATLSSGDGAIWNWSFAVTPYPGTNILSVQAVDISGNASPTVSRTFFYEASAPLTIQTIGSGIGSFNIPNGRTLNIGQAYSITAQPISSTFQYWLNAGATNFFPTFSFVMSSNLVLTADFLARPSPAVSIAFPKPGEHVETNVFTGTATPSPLLSGVDPTNIALTGVKYWLTNLSDGTVQTGLGTLSSGDTFSNWSLTVTPHAATNILAVQSLDASGGRSRVASRAFFYDVPTALGIATNGNGSGAVSLTNLSMLNIGQIYEITARPGQYSKFAGWSSSAGTKSAQPVFSFIMQPGLVLTATFTLLPPSVTITSPRANSRAPIAPVFAGTAAGRVPITNVVCSLANGFVGASTNALAVLDSSSGDTTAWSAALTPWPGSNVLRVYSVDANGAQSAVVSRAFFLQAKAALTVSNAGPGSGTLKGRAFIPGDAVPANGAMLYLGESYSIAALPDKSSLFSNWVSASSSSAGTTSDNPILSFVMESNLVLTASFVSNFFPSAVGQYTGLFLPAGAATTQNAGMIQNLAVTANGAFSGRLLLADTNYSFSSKFSVARQAALVVGGLQVNLALDTTIPQITGSIVGSGFDSTLVAEFATNVVPAVRYTLLLRPFGGAGNIPPGDGYALVSSHGAAITLAGALADGTRINQTIPVSISGDIPIFQSLYAAPHGLLIGWLNETNLAGTAVPGALDWIKKSSPLPRLYTNGFTNILTVFGSVWAQSPLATPEISLAGASLVLTNASLDLDFTNIDISGNKVADEGSGLTNTLTGVINPETGLLTLTFGTGNGRDKGHAFGAILLNMTNAGGYFLTATNGGVFRLQPQP